ncbi:MAG: nitroreductase family protein [Proteobacteria bacterium]|nr:nitroreductase family protein [Pseudomonadota bacterium]
MIKDFQPVPLPDYREIPVEEMRARATSFYEAIRRRHTVRDFSDRPVPRDIIETCLKAAGTAPNGANHQPWHFCVIGDPAVKRRIREAAEVEEKEFYAGKAGEEWLKALAPLGTDADKPFLDTAPWLIAVFGARKSVSADGVLRKNYYVSESVNIAVGFLIAALHQAGLATLTHTPAPMGFLNEICGRPDEEKPYILMVVGYPAEHATIPAHAMEKKPLGEIVSFL